ncbi:MAG TPA: DUF2917 domain-containing protein [Rubrivivax sp.]|nr:DUF2917 domain-containing protein [Rubrivivax sp.]
MDQSLMCQPHQTAPWDWTLDGREAQTVDAAPEPRWLRVADGCLWLTRRDSHGQRDDDLWLTAGQSLALPAGTEWVLQAWPQARVSLLLQAPMPAGRPSSVTEQRWWLRPSGWLRFSVLHA